MNMNEITKVTVWNVTATVNKATGKLEAPAETKDKPVTANKWCVAVFTKANGAMPLASFLLGADGKDVKKYVGVYRHSQAVVLAAEFAAEYKLKAAETTVMQELAVCKGIVEGEKAEKAARAAERKAHPELAAARKFEKAVEGLQKVAVKSSNIGFKRAVIDISKKTNSMLEQLEAEVDAAENVDPKQAELAALAAA